MDWASRLGGGLLVAIVLRDVFATLFNPSGRGLMAMVVFRAMWAAVRRLGGRARALAGPLSLVAVISLWTVLLILGWALVYAPDMPEGFVLGTGLSPSDNDALFDALYLSWVTQATLGFGDIVPRTEALRIAAPLQATVGFGLFTMAVTWVLSIYPALQRRRTLAGAVHALRAAHHRRGEAPQAVPPAALARSLDRLTEGLSSVRVDAIQYPSTLFFTAPSPTMSLAEGLPYLRELSSAEGLAPEAAATAAELDAALEQLAGTIADQLGFGTSTVDDTLAAYRRHAGAAP